MLLIGVFLIGMGYVAYRDWTEFRVPDHATLALAVFGLVWIAVAFPGQWMAHIAAAVIGGVVFVSIGEAYRRLRGRDGLGLGDAKLVAVGGLWLGIKLPMAMAIGTGVALCMTLALVAAGRRSVADPIPLGTYLCAGLAMTFLI